MDASALLLGSSSDLLEEEEGMGYERYYRYPSAPPTPLLPALPAGSSSTSTGSSSPVSSPVWRPTPFLDTNVVPSSALDTVLEITQQVNLYFLLTFIPYSLVANFETVIAPVSHLV